MTVRSINATLRIKGNTITDKVFDIIIVVLSYCPEANMCRLLSVAEYSTFWGALCPHQTSNVTSW